MDDINRKLGCDATGPWRAVYSDWRIGNCSSNVASRGQRLTNEALERAQTALSYIDPNLHDHWLKVGMGLKAEFGDDGWQIFDGWSRTAENYNAQQNRLRWTSWKRCGVTIATLFKLSRDAGWRDDGLPILPDREVLAARARAHAETEDKYRKKRERAAANAANRASAIWSVAAVVSGGHPYCERKGISATEKLREIDAAKAANFLAYSPSAAGERLRGRCLVVPITIGDKITSLQLIDSAGRKHFLAGGAVSGAYWPMQPLPEGDGNELMVLIAEGIATLLSAAQAMPQVVDIAAMMNSNIPAVARLMRNRYPLADIVVLCDLDKKTGEPDKYAVEAAKAVGGRLAMPEFADGPSKVRKDFNDLSRVHGDDAVRLSIERALAPGQSDGAVAKAEDKPKAKVKLVLASTIKPVPIVWVWGGYLARGKMHILAGKPAAGKTTLAIGMAAIVTTGGTWPDGTRCAPGRVVIWSGEDDPADTLVPRLIAAGADLDRVQFVGGAIEDSKPVLFDPAKHMTALAETLSSIDEVALLIVDPVVSAVAGDSHKNAEVRRALQPLADLGTKSKCAILGITHFTKGTAGRDPVERLTGSLAFGAVARIVLVAAQAEADPEEGSGSSSECRRLMMRAKSNIGAEGGGFEYDLAQRTLLDHSAITASAVNWGRAVEGSARDLLVEAEASDSEDRNSVTDAANWLGELLSSGPIDQPTIQSRAKEVGHSWAAIRRAKKRLGVKPRKQGMEGGWIWELPRRCS